MPIYEYECANCHHHFDLIQKISDAPTKKCPQCFEDSAVRLISAPGFQLKGSGWYATDFKNDQNKPKHEKKDAGDKSASTTSSQPSTAADSPKTSKGESD